MKKVFLVIIFLSCAVLNGQEVGTLTAPITRANITTYEIDSVSMARLPAWSLNICYQDNFGNILCDSHTGLVSVVGVTGADVLVKQLNKANLSIQSLECRAILHLISEGKIPAGTCTGTPQ